MNILFIHQNFPAQFKNLAKKLYDNGHNVKALTQNKLQLEKIESIVYPIDKINSTNIHFLCKDFETKIIRGEASMRALIDLKKNGYYPNITIAHGGWGESLYVKDIFPKTKLITYFEYYYSSEGQDFNFDPEFTLEDYEYKALIRNKNAHNLLNFESSDLILTPTRWQRSTIPNFIDKDIHVIHDGINTNKLLPNPNIKIRLKNGLFLSKKIPIVTFINRNFEPLRGYHSFMRALVHLQKLNKEFHALLIGGDGNGYGKKTDVGSSYKDIFFNEVKNDLDTSRVHFLGTLNFENYIKILQISSVHVYLSYPFVLSWSMLEAMSVGCPIVGSKTGPVMEVIKNRENGLLAEFFDYTSLAEITNEVLCNQELAKMLGLNARNHIKNLYDLETICLPKQVDLVHSLS
jgi:glycosyltransferase involved in cell wall biosynthesis